MTTAFVPRRYPRTRLPGGRVLSDAQQHQYDVLRTVGGRLIHGKDGWYREVPYDNGTTTREKIYGLNATAAWKLVELGLVVCADDATTGGYLFVLPDLAKDVPGRRYDRVNHVVSVVPNAPTRECRACDGDGYLAADSSTPHNERLTRDSRRCTYCDGTGVSRERAIGP